MRTQPTSRGFTLIELLVVISIIAMLASVVLVSLNNTRQKALKTKAREEIGQIVSAANTARLLNDTTLIGVTGNACSSCGGEAMIVASLQKISQKSGILGVEKIRNDPWGGKYEMNEMEGELGSTDCRRDTFWATAEPDSSTIYYLDYQTAYCKANPVGFAGWQASM